MPGQQRGQQLGLGGAQVRQPDRVPDLLAVRQLLRAAQQFRDPRTAVRRAGPGRGGMVLQPLPQPGGQQLLGGHRRAEHPVPPGQQRVRRRSDRHDDHRERGALVQCRGQPVQIHRVRRLRTGGGEGEFEQVPGAVPLLQRAGQPAYPAVRAVPAVRIDPQHPGAGAGLGALLRGRGDLVEEGQRGAGASGAGGGAEHQQPTGPERGAQPQVPLRLHMDPAQPAQFLVGHRAAAQPRGGLPGVHPQMDVADMGALDERAVEAVQVAAGVEQHPGGAPGPRGGGEVGGPVLALLPGERVAGVLLEPPRGALPFVLLLRRLAVGGLPAAVPLALFRALLAVPLLAPGLVAGLGGRSVGRLVRCGVGGAARLLFVGHLPQPFRRSASPVVRPMCTGWW